MKYLLQKGAFKLAIFCVRNRHVITAPGRHRQQRGPLNWANFMLHWFMRNPEFTEFLFHLRKTELFIILVRVGIELFINIKRASNSITRQTMSQVCRHGSSTWPWLWSWIIRKYNLIMFIILFILLIWKWKENRLSQSQLNKD